MAGLRWYTSECSGGGGMLLSGFFDSNLLLICINWRLASLNAFCVSLVRFSGMSPVFSGWSWLWNKSSGIRLSTP